MTTSSACSTFCILLICVTSPAASQQPADAHVKVNIAPGATLERTFPVKNDMDCPRDTYRFQLTSGSDFVSFPDEIVELSRSRGTQVRVKFDSNGLEPGTHISNITLDCKNCTGCRSSDKVMQVALTVVAGSEPAAEAIVEPAAARLVNEAQLRLPDVTGTTLSDAQDQLAGLGLQPVTDSMGIERVELITVIAQQPAAGEPVEAGARVILTPGVPVPDLPGLAAGEAQNRLDEVGLLLVTTTGDGTATASQVPAAGAIVAIGTTVTLLLPVLETPAASGAWLAVLALLLAVAGAIFFWRASRRIRAAPAASFDVRSTVDSGSQHVRSDSSEPQRPVIRVRLAGDGGEQSVQGSPASITEKEWR